MSDTPHPMTAKSLTITIDGDHWAGKSRLGEVIARYLEDQGVQVEHRDSHKRPERDLEFLLDPIVRYKQSVIIISE